jgi:hypothetical protein
VKKKAPGREEEGPGGPIDTRSQGIQAGESAGIPSGPVSRVQERFQEPPGEGREVAGMGLQRSIGIEQGAGQDAFSMPASGSQAVR